MTSLIRNSYFFYIFISSGLATAFYRSQEGIIITFLLTVAVGVYYKIPLAKSYGKTITIWVVYSIMAFILHSVFTPFFIFRFITYITVAYVVVMLYRNDIFTRYENYVFIFAAISLFFFVWQLLSKGSLMSFARLIDISGEMKRGSEEYRNFLVHTVEINPSDASYERNYGFAFEPGTYAIYLSVAILFNLLRTKVCLSVKENTRFYVLLLALITTFSTTGYIALGVIIIYLMFTEFKGLSKYFYLAAVVSFSIYLFVTVDFLYDKMEELFYGGRDVEELLYKAEETGFSYSAGRFGGFVIGWEDFKENPLFGRGGVSDLTVGVKGEGRVYIVNGMANIMSQFGVFGLAVFFIFLFKSSLMIAVEFDSRAYLITFFTFVIGIVAFAIHTQYILFTIMFCSFFVKSFSHCSLVVSPVFNVKQLHRQKF